MNRELLLQLRLLTQEEEDAGFRKYLVHDPEDTPCGPEGLVLTVGYKISSSEMIFKTTDDWKIGYKHRQFGTIGDDPGETPRWHPIGIGVFQTPGEAIQGANFEDPGNLAYKVKPFDFVHKDFSE
jgi:hypothetical protein